MFKQITIGLFGSTSKVIKYPSYHFFVGFVRRLPLLFVRPISVVAIIVATVNIVVIIIFVVVVVVLTGLEAILM